MVNISKHLDVPNTLARNASISGVYEDVDQRLITSLKSNLIDPKPLLICSGGTSNRCAADRHWTLDLRKNFNYIGKLSNNNEIDIGAGSKMGTLIQTLCKKGRSFPIGLSGETGLGYILTGGISPLSRSEGLAIDQIVEIQGIYGNGEGFKITKPNRLSSPKDISIWKGLSGAAPFFSIVTNIKVKTKEIEPLIIIEADINPDLLVKIIRFAEECSIYSSIQWIWCETIRIYVVIKVNQEAGMKDLNGLKNLFGSKYRYKATKSNGLIGIPSFSNNKIKPNNEIASEVIGLLSPEWGNDTNKIVTSLIYDLISTRPHPKCSIASQQLGGVTNTKNNSSFVHRNSIWKPWITAAWEINDEEGKNLSIKWLEMAWETLEIYCPWVHIAQIHTNSKWKSKEAHSAYGNWLPGLINLKSDLDPNGILPSIL